MKRSIVACAVLAVTACQSYSTVTLGAVPAGADIRVALTDSGSRYVTQFIGSRAEQLEGTVTRADSSGLALNVSEITRAGGATELGEGKAVEVPAGLIASVSRQTTSVSRSILLTGAIVAGGVLAGQSLGKGSGSAGKGTGTISSPH